MAYVKHSIISFGIMSTLKDKLSNIPAMDEKHVEPTFRDIAESILYGGYIKVRDEYRIYVKTVEFYFHAEEGSIFHISDPIVYHRNGKFPGMNLPYFPLLTLHAHVSGFDITFENEQYKYRASALIRAYAIYDVKSKSFIKNEKGKIYDDRSTFLYNYLNGFSLDNSNDIEWVDEKTKVLHVISEPSPRKNVYVYVDGNKTDEKDMRPWSFTRTNDIEP